MKITLLAGIVSALALCLAGTARAGDPIPGVDVSLEQVPGGKVASSSHCGQLGGKIIRKGGKTYCALARRRKSKK